MDIEKIKKNLIAFKGNIFIYFKSYDENNDPVFFYKILTSEEMKLIDKNPALLIDWDS